MGDHTDLPARQGIHVIGEGTPGRERVAPGGAKISYSQKEHREEAWI